MFGENAYDSLGGEEFLDPVEEEELDEDNLPEI